MIATYSYGAIEQQPQYISVGFIQTWNSGVVAGTTWFELIDGLSPVNIAITADSLVTIALSANSKVITTLDEDSPVTIEVDENSKVITQIDGESLLED